MYAAVALISFIEMKRQGILGGAPKKEHQYFDARNGLLEIYLYTGSSRRHMESSPVWFANIFEPVGEIY
jgi:hypothetical protein